MCPCFKLHRVGAMSFSTALVLIILISSNYYNKPPPHAGLPAVEDTESRVKNSKMRVLFFGRFIIHGAEKVNGAETGREGQGKPVCAQ